MSDSVAKPPEPEPFGDNLTRSDVLGMLEIALLECKGKIESGRIRDPENEKVRIQWIKAMGYLANQYRQVQRDKELEEMQAKIEALESAI